LLIELLKGKARFSHSEAYRFTERETKISLGSGDPWQQNIIQTTKHMVFLSLFLLSICW